MIINPVYRREITVASRSIRIPIIIAAFNLILAIFALVMMEIIVDSARYSAQISYGEFLTMFRYLAIIEFLLVLLVMPAITAGSISGERERRTLDLMLTTKISPLGIVTGKLWTALSTVMILVVSSLPILALVFAYGGVTVMNIVILFVGYFTSALFAAAVGIWSSSISRKSSTSTTISYITLLVLLVGTVAAVILRASVSGDVGYFFNILLINPLMTFYSAITLNTGYGGIMSEIASSFGGRLLWNSELEWILAGMIIQIIFSIILLAFAVKHVTPRGKRK